MRTIFTKNSPLILSNNGHIYSKEAPTSLVINKLGFKGRNSYFFNGSLGNWMPLLLFVKLPEIGEVNLNGYGFPRLLRITDNNLSSLVYKSLG